MCDARWNAKGFTSKYTQNDLERVAKYSFQQVVKPIQQDNTHYWEPHLGVLTSGLITRKYAGITVFLYNHLRAKWFVSDTKDPTES